MAWGRSSAKASVVASSFVWALAAWPGHARAEDTTRTLDPIAPPTLPSLTRRDFGLDLSFTGARLAPPDGDKDPARGTAYAWFAHAQLDYPIEPRRWFFGTAFDLASGAVPGVGRELFYGNPEMTIRGVWSNQKALSAGGSLGLVVPLPRDLGTRGRAVLDTINVVRPFDNASFSESSLTARPALDVRLVAFPVVLQLRQGLDFSYSFVDGSSDVLARAGAYLGFDLLDPVGIGVELFEVYAITKEIPDDSRSAFTFSPSVRVRLHGVEPGVSLLVPFGTPLGATASTFFAVRVHASITLDPMPDAP